MKDIRCPGCGEEMDRRDFERKPLGTVELDICYGCQSIWFDQYESAQLTPGAVLQLFTDIHQHHDKPVRPLAQNLRCPGCRQPLALTQDIQRTNRITYYRCASGHGRLTTFFQFLREKNFVRSLSPGEVEKLRATVKQVRCSSCGAPVDIARDSQCGYCRSPIAILDPEAVRRTVAELGAAERSRKQVDPTAAMDALLAGKRFEHKLARIEGRAPARDGAVDLVNEALHLLMSD